jgi:predicted nucleotidyltransferase
LFDFSKIDDLRPLARLVARIDSLCPESTFLIAGAQARDLLLKYGYDIDTSRRTSDVDFALRVGSWAEFHEIRSALLASGEFAEYPRALHKLKFRGVLEVDIVPFGGIESPGRTIAWPPDQDFEMSMFGFEEILGSVIEVQLPEEQSAKVVSLAALALLKLEAWRDRRRREPGKDAHDFRLILPE